MLSSFLQFFSLASPAALTATLRPSFRRGTCLRPCMVSVLPFAPPWAARRHVTQPSVPYHSLSHRSPSSQASPTVNMNSSPFRPQRRPRCRLSSAARAVKIDRPS
ncbi:hypothetical protein B0T25DRAFT_190572 [Lasiosphaeria hispida]|uniref:Secreted protein n=1 Tax=Lasiosphaeria hispida TaxID=260671 RepID=A0AAJ0HHA0_9PEZI|nr:hypothetical protein B0T25DRAFT_190572 [Lasiosphaeria hispida]